MPSFQECILRNIIILVYAAGRKLIMKQSRYRDSSASTTFRYWYSQKKKTEKTNTLIDADECLKRIHPEDNRGYLLSSI